MLFVQCRPDVQAEGKPELMVSHWFFNSEPSCVNVLTDSLSTLAIGTEDGKLYLMRGEEIEKLRVNLGERIYKLEYLGRKDGLEFYLVSVRHKGLHVIGINGEGKISKDIICVYENDCLPYKYGRYTAYDWFSEADGDHCFATSNGIWSCCIRLDELNLRQDTLTMKRVGQMGAQKVQYAVTSLSSFAGKIYFSSQDGFWVYDGNEPRRISEDTVKYNMIQDKGRLTAFNDRHILTIDEHEQMQVSPNQHKAKFIIPVNDSTSYYLSNNKLYVNDQTEGFNLRVTQYAKNTFAMIERQGMPHGVFMIQGNDLIYVDVQLVMMYNPATVLGLCERKKDNSAYLIDRNWNLYNVSDTYSKLIGRIVGVNEAITDMVVMNDEIYLVTDYSLYHIPTEASLFNRIKAERIDLLKDRQGINPQAERMMALYNHDRNSSLIIATRANLWNYDVGQPLSASNPTKLHIKARLPYSDELQNLENIYESGNVQCMARYPYKNSADLLVGTRDFGILSFDKQSINTLVPESWLGLNDKSIWDVRSIDVLIEEGHDRIKIAVASADNLYLVTFSINAANCVASQPYSAKNARFIDDHHVLAVSEFGGITLFDTQADTLVSVDTHYRKIHFKPQMASMETHVLLNSNVGPYLFDKATQQLTVLNLTPDDAPGPLTYLLYTLLALVCLALGYNIAVKFIRLRKLRRLSLRLRQKEQEVYGTVSQPTLFSMVLPMLKQPLTTITLEETSRRISKLLKWWDKSLPADDSQIYQERISSLIKHLPSLAYNFDDEFQTLKADNEIYALGKTIHSQLAAKYLQDFGSVLPDFLTSDILRPADASQVSHEKLSRRMKKFCEWWTSTTHSTLSLKTEIDSLFEHRLEASYDFSEELKHVAHLYESRFTITEVFGLLPSTMQHAAADNHAAMSLDIIRAVRVARMEIEWLCRASEAYSALTIYEQKIGKANPAWWHLFMDGNVKELYLPAFGEPMQREVWSVLKYHSDADYSSPLFTTSSGVLSDWPDIPLPPRQEEGEEDTEYILKNSAVLRTFLTAYYDATRPTSRLCLVRRFTVEKEAVEDALRATYLRIVGMEHQTDQVKSKLIDYYKNLLTYLYYTLFVKDDCHLLAYNDKERKYDSLYDFQQQIVVLSTFLGSSEGADSATASRYDMRPLLLQDKLYLTMEGNDSKENPISKFKDKTKTLHIAFYKKTDWEEYTAFVDLLFEVYPPLKKLYGQRPKRMEKNTK